MRSLLAAVLAVFLTLPVACGDDDDSDRDRCEPGDERTCYCGDGKKGTQGCLEEGTYENLCSCSF